MNAHAISPVLLVILDGWGYRQARADNAIANADTPVWDSLWQRAPHTLLSASGPDVGLPDGQMGNSEVGHMCLGAGRVVYQNIARIDRALKDGEFDRNPAYTRAIDSALSAGGAVHIMGLLSAGGVHSHERHLCAAIELAHRRGARRIYLHAFLDGRDTPPRSARASLEKVEQLFSTLACGRIASLVGRYYAMDRDRRWERLEPVWQMLTAARAPYRAATAVAGLQQAYGRGESDEFVQATLVQGDGADAAPIQDGDSVLFMNFRADRARQLTQAFVAGEFAGFRRAQRPLLSAFVMTTDYAADLEAACAWPSAVLHNVLPEYLASLGKTQLRMAETEKYAHVTFFFSGGREQPYAGEERIMVASPQVATYDLQPAMSAPELTDRLVESIAARKFDLIVCNYANGDMVGHTGNYAAAIQAVETLDVCLGRVQQALAEVGGQALITADHGNCEQMADYASGQQHTRHTTELVPLVYLGDRAIVRCRSGGGLADVAPSLLALMDQTPPAEMTGRNLLELA